jgi:hypothetical protein
MNSPVAKYTAQSDAGGSSVLRRNLGLLGKPHDPDLRQTAPQDQQLDGFLKIRAWRDLDTACRQGPP